jgi:hypothetical protein
MARKDPSKYTDSESTKIPAKIGSAMFDLAKKYLRIEKDIEAISGEEFKKMMGLPYSKFKLDNGQSYNDFLIKCKEDGLDIGMLGFISSNTKTYILTTPISAAFLLLHIEHLEDSIPIDNEELDNIDLPMPIQIDVMKLFYLKSLIKEFPGYIVKEGKEKMKELEIVKEVFKWL